MNARDLYFVYQTVMKSQKKMSTSERRVEYINMCLPILALKRLVAGVPGGVGEASHNSSISVSCEERGDAEGGEEMGRMATHLTISFCPHIKNEARDTYSIHR